MKQIILPALALLLSLGCGGSSDPNKIVLDGKFDVEAGKFAFKKVTVDRMGSFTLTIHPEGGDVEAWFSPGEAQPLVIYNANEPLPMARKFAAGKEDTATGTCDWGGHHVVVFNRGPGTVKVRCKLVVVENPPKS